MSAIASSSMFSTRRSAKRWIGAPRSAKAHPRPRALVERLPRRGDRKIGLRGTAQRHLRSLVILCVSMTPAQGWSWLDVVDVPEVPSVTACLRMTRDVRP